MAHHKIIGSELGEAGKLQMWLQGLYATNEPWILRLLDFTLRCFTKLKAKPILWVLARLVGRILPTAEVVTHDRAAGLIDTMTGLGHPQIAVGPCRCQEAFNKRDGTLMKDMVILYGAETYRGALDTYEDLSPDEAKARLQELRTEGMIPALFACMRSKGWLFVICNCESKICFPFRAHKQVGAAYSPGPDVVALATDKCVKCGKCVERCHFEANSLDGTGHVELAKCYGCGLCVSTCAGGARTMVERRPYRNRYYPVELIRAASSD
jgi:ferredoxin